MPISMEEKVFPRALYWIAKGDSHFVVDPDCGGREPPLQKNNNILIAEAVSLR